MVLANPYTYTGRRLDSETGLYQYRNRYYHAQLGRFVSRDPIGYEGSEWNLYEYVGNPIGSVDPLGLAAAPPPPRRGRWGTPDFVLHYWVGFGRGVRLEEVGLGDVFWSHPSVTSAIDEFVLELDEQIQDGFDRISHQGVGSCEAQTYVVSRRSEKHTNVTDAIFVKGDGTLKLNATCSVSLSECTDPCGDRDCRDYSVSCSYRFNSPDEFVDPLDIYETLGVPLEVGIPYDLSAQATGRATSAGNTCEGSPDLRPSKVRPFVTVRDKRGKQ